MDYERPIDKVCLEFSQPVSGPFHVADSNHVILVRLKWLVVEPIERKARWPKVNNGDENLYWKWYSLERDVAAWARRQLTRPDWHSWDVAFWLAQAGRGRSDWSERV